MSYRAPYIDETGYHYPTYQEILDDLISSFQAIYGSGIYLGSDSQDYQMISIFALKIFDTYQAVELAYNSHSPVTAIGAALDDIVAINGIKRLQGSRSVADVVLSGTNGTVVNNGVLSDITGILWDLPETVVIGADGTVTAQVTCRETGVHVAAPNTIVRIMTPTIGWVSVTNPASAVTGTSVEPDSSLRARQITSVAQPSQSILKGLQGALLALNCVQRCTVLENDTDDTDDNGLPPHSICAVVDYDDEATTAEDDEQTIATTILNYKSCGCATYGDVTESVGEYTIYFQKMQPIDVVVQVTIQALENYSSAYVNRIKLALADYLSSFAPGQSVSISMLSAVVMNVNENLTNPAFKVTLLKAAQDGETPDVADVDFDFYEVAHGNESEISVTVVTT